MSQRRPVGDVGKTIAIPIAAAASGAVLRVLYGQTAGALAAARASAAQGRREHAHAAQRLPQERAATSPEITCQSSFKHAEFTKAMSRISASQTIKNSGAPVSQGSILICKSINTDRRIDVF